MTADSFAVDLRALTEFAAELTTQLTAMATPLGALTELVDSELQLGAFGEARALCQRHHAAVEDLHALVAQARDALVFAEDVTRVVHDAYRDHDAGAAGSIASVSGQGPGV